MKTALISTGITTPLPKSKYSYSDQDAENRTTFENKIIELLELPENWDKYLQFKSSDDYISLTEKGYYKAISFRKFKRGKEAVITPDLKATILDFIATSIQSEKERADAKDKDEYYTELVAPILDKYRSIEIEASYFKAGIQIKLVSRQDESTWRYTTTLGECKIFHSGNIGEPIFEFNSTNRYGTTISMLENWIKEHTEIRDKIIEIAKNIKADLPQKFFITDKT